jgi:hypothetical protein
LFTENDTIFLPNQKIFDKSRENLINTDLFNFAAIFHDAPYEGKINVRVQVKERWYLWPVPVVELTNQNLNQWLREKDLSKLTYGVAVTRQNFRGRKEVIGGTVKAGYDNHYMFKYSVPYLNKKLSKGISLTFTYSRTHNLAIADSNNHLVSISSSRIISERSGGTFQFIHRYGFYNFHHWGISFSDLKVAEEVINKS